MFWRNFFHSIKSTRKKNDILTLLTLPLADKFRVVIVNNKLSNRLQILKHRKNGKKILTHRNSLPVKSNCLMASLLVAHKLKWVSKIILQTQRHNRIWFFLHLKCIMWTVFNYNLIFNIQETNFDKQHNDRCYYQPFPYSLHFSTWLFTFFFSFSLYYFIWIGVCAHSWCFKKTATRE